MIPERAAARVWVRALDDATLEGVVSRVQACARGAAEGSGTRLEANELGGASPPLRPNLALAEVYRQQLGRLGLVERTHPMPTSGRATSPVSRVVPTIHPNFPIGSGLELHTRAFAAATASPAGEAGLLEAARALALSVAALVRSPDARAAIAAAGSPSV